MPAESSTENGNGRAKKKKTPDAVVKKVQDLIELATSDNEDEARTAALTAIRLMREHQLVCVDRAMLEAIEQAKKVVEGANALMVQAKGEATQKMMIGAGIGFLLAKQFKL
jgi:Protein of unknown function (DUF2786)